MSEHQAGHPQTAAPLERGTTISGRYRLDAPLASGGMAVVWRATDTVLARPVAIKVLHADLAADPEFVARFRREAVAAARLTHPSIVATYDTSTDPESIIMELVEGRTLRDELDRRDFLSPTEAAEIASGVCLALEVAHKAGIVHRDIKPANVLLSTSGQLKVADFGIAKAGGPRRETEGDLPDLTAVGRMVGTAKYLAPEQVSGGPVDARTDVYAVGAVLYEMLCGRPPFRGDNDLAVATARLQMPPERPRQVLRTVPSRLDEIVMRALAIDPEDRYPSASAMWADLQSSPVEDEMAPPAPLRDATIVDAQPSFARTERNWLVPALLISMVAVALGLAWLLVGGTQVQRELLDLVDRVAPGGESTDDERDEAVVVSAAAFDPLGDRTEHDDEAPRAVDDDPDTGWTTERYDTRSFGGLKSGVGLVVELDAPAEVAEVSVETPNRGWSADVYVSASAGPTLASWGRPVGAISGAGDDAVIDVDGSMASFVLVWFTDLGTDAGVQLDVRELHVRSG